MWNIRVVCSLSFMANTKRASTHKILNSKRKSCSIIKQTAHGRNRTFWKKMLLTDFSVRCSPLNEICMFTVTIVIARSLRIDSIHFLHWAFSSLFNDSFARFVRLMIFRSPLLLLLSIHNVCEQFYEIFGIFPLEGHQVFSGIFLVVHSRYRAISVSQTIRNEHSQKAKERNENVVNEQHNNALLQLHYSSAVTGWIQCMQTRNGSPTEALCLNMLSCIVSRLS